MEVILSKFMFLRNVGRARLKETAIALLRTGGRILALILILCDMTGTLFHIIEIWRAIRGLHKSEPWV